MTFLSSVIVIYCFVCSLLEIPCFIFCEHVELFQGILLVEIMIRYCVNFRCFSLCSGMCNTLRGGRTLIEYSSDLFIIAVLGVVEVYAYCGDNSFLKWSLTSHLLDS